MWAGEYPPFLLERMLIKASFGWAAGSVESHYRTGSGVLGAELTCAVQPGDLTKGCRRGRPSGPLLPPACAQEPVPKDQEELKIPKKNNGTYRPELEPGARSLTPREKPGKAFATSDNCVARGVGTISPNEIRAITDVDRGNQSASSTFRCCPPMGGCVLLVSDTRRALTFPQVSRGKSTVRSRNRRLRRSIKPDFWTTPALILANPA